MRIENYDIEDFNLIVEKDFEQTIAYFANVPLADVQVLSVKQGSIIIDFKVNFANANVCDGVCCCVANVRRVCAYGGE